MPSHAVRPRSAGDDTPQEPRADQRPREQANFGRHEGFQRRHEQSRLQRVYLSRPYEPRVRLSVGATPSRLPTEQGDQCRAFEIDGLADTLPSLHD